MFEMTNTTVDVSTCPGPTGEPIPLLHFDDELGSGAKLAVSLAQGRAVFTTPAYPLDLDATAIMLSQADRRELARWLLEGLDD